MEYGALGLIEVIGYPTAIEAADAAVKAANVKLLSITKVDGGIMTVQLMGDVGAIKAAVDAGAASAEKVGQVRAAHVIPRVGDSLFETVLKPTPKKPMQQIPPVPVEPVNNEQQSVDTSEAFIGEDKEEIGKEILKPNEAKDTPDMAVEIAAQAAIQPNKQVEISNAIEELQTKSNSGLRKLITDLNLDIQDKKLTTLKKQELIDVLEAYYKAKKGEA